MLPDHWVVLFLAVGPLVLVWKFWKDDEENISRTEIAVGIVLTSLALGCLWILADEKAIEQRRLASISVNQAVAEGIRPERGVVTVVPVGAYSGPPNPTVRGTIEAGETFNLLRQQGEWLLVGRLPSGSFWVHGDSVRFRTQPEEWDTVSSAAVRTLRAMYLPHSTAADNLWNLLRILFVGFLARLLIPLLLPAGDSQELATTGMAVAVVVGHAVTNGVGAVAVDVGAVVLLIAPILAAEIALIEWLYRFPASH